MVAAAVYTKLSSEGDGGAKPEDDDQAFECGWEGGVDTPGFVESDWQEEEEGEHGEHNAEHSVVDHGWRGSHSDHVTDEGHDDDGNEKLCEESIGCPVRKLSQMTYLQNAQRDSDDLHGGGDVESGDVECGIC